MLDTGDKRIESAIAAKLDRVHLLGNHYKKNLRNIEEFLPLLLKRLSQSDTLRFFDFQELSPFCYEEMELIRWLSHDGSEALDLLGCYYSLLLVTMNLNLLDRLALEPDAFMNRTDMYKAFLLKAEKKFSLLYSALIRIFLEILSEDEKDLPEFVICHVGARRDQDDIDVGIIHRAGGDLVALNRVIGRLNREMFRRATQMHFYLSEHSGSKWFSATIGEYENLMDVELKNLVIITQLFGAVPITGRISLFQEFQERVVKRYTYREGGDNRYYEGFMRGFVEEIRSLVQHRSPRGEIVPKVDGLRLAKMLVVARRATLGILGGQFWKAFEELKKQDFLFQEEYRYLEKAIAFMELVRFLYQMIFVQEEGIPFTDVHCRSALDRVALVMGYSDRVSQRPSTALLRDYFQYSRKVEEISEVFKEEFKRYVEFVRIFRGLVDREESQDTQSVPVNLATDYIEVMARFHRSLPWGEFISFLEEEPGYCKRFFRDLDILAPARMERTLQRYFGSMAGDGETLVRFLLCFLKSPWREQMKQLEKEWVGFFWDIFRRTLRQSKEALRFLAENEVLCREFVKFIPEDLVVAFLVEVRKLRGLLKVRMMDRVEPLSFLYHYRNPLMQRRILGIVERGLVREEELADAVSLRAASGKALTRLSLQTTYDGCCQMLENYYNLEILGFAIHSIRTGRFPRAHYMDRYIRRLTQVALREAGLAKIVRDRSGLAIYATGGNARVEGLAEDYDMFVLHDPSRIDPSMLHGALQRIHRELARLGNMPHHRIGEQVGSFSVSLGDLEAYLDHGHPTDFIERSELLGSRKVFGGRPLHQQFQERIIRQRIFGHKRNLVRALAVEIRERQAEAQGSVGLDIKHGRGGLFDITLLLSMLKAFYEIYESRDVYLLRLLQKRDPSHTAEYKTLFYGRSFLVDIRGILKLTGFTEVIDETMDIRYPALLKGFSDPEPFFRKVTSQMQRVALATDCLIRDVMKA